MISVYLFLKQTEKHQDLGFLSRAEVFWSETPVRHYVGLSNMMVGMRKASERLFLNYQDSYFLKPDRV